MGWVCSEGRSVTGLPRRNERSVNQSIDDNQARVNLNLFLQREYFPYRVASRLHDLVTNGHRKKQQQVQQRGQETP